MKIVARAAALLIAAAAVVTLSACDPSEELSTFPSVTAPANVPAPVTVELTGESEQAAGKAREYLALDSGFSRKGLIDQLAFDGFSQDDATSAVDSLGVDWDAQAVLKAKAYLDLTSFSRQGLIDQLTFDGFTPEQAAHGADGAGL